MNLLVIGNGFDLAHGLKTTYLDFLEWAYDNGRMGTYKKFSLSDYWYYFSRSSKEERTASGKRFFIPEFIPQLFQKYENWIDLESNMAAILSKYSTFTTQKSLSLLRRFEMIFNEFILPEFEEYIATVVNFQTPERKYDMANSDLILNFNYSNTFERIYNSNKNICYINGKAESSTKNSSIVFGFDYSYDDLCQWDLYKFDKAYQRAYKNADSRYKDWMNQNGYNIHIFGHSLGSTDHDILLPFIKNTGSSTTVYYHNEKSRQQLIYRMIKMVGKEFFNQNPIKFIHINNFQMYKPNSTISWEIS